MIPIKRIGVVRLGTFNEVWQRVAELEGREFKQVQGKTFTYKLTGNSVVPNTTNIIIPRTQFEKAWLRMPVTGPGAINDLIAPSYLFARVLSCLAADSPQHL